jgi:adenine-specific DNA-methyltransferase
MRAALDFETADRVLRLPVSDQDGQTLALVDAWPTTLHSLGLEISTGPVVPFRATAVVDREGRVPDTHAPLLWMHHVRGTQVTWPLNRRKPEYIRRRGAEALLIPNRNYVLMRRFSAKEEARRLAAAPYIAGDFAIPEVGLENHLNYVHRPGGTLSDDETWGLTALYNSRLLDTYFRCVNGNTQVSATELRAMPLPARDVVVALGRRVMRLPDPMAELDGLVMDMVAGAVPVEMEVVA